MPLPPTYRFKSTQYVKFDSPEETEKRARVPLGQHGRNKVMFRGKHSLGIVLPLFSHSVSVPPLLFPSIRHTSSLFFFRSVSVFCVLDDSISLLCSLFLFASPVVIFFLQKSKAQTVCCPSSDCRRLEIQYVQCLCWWLCVLFKCFFVG